jgi:hypothetical protein
MVQERPNQGTRILWSQRAGQGVTTCNRPSLRSFFAVASSLVLPSAHQPVNLVPGFPGPMLTQVVEELCSDPATHPRPETHPRAKPLQSGALQARNAKNNTISCARPRRADATGSVPPPDSVPIAATAPEISAFWAPARTERCAGEPANVPKRARSQIPEVRPTEQLHGRSVAES